MKRLILLVALLLLAYLPANAQSLGGGAWVTGFQTNVFLQNPATGTPTTNIYSAQFPAERFTVGNMTNGNQTFGCGYGYAILSFYGTNTVPFSTNWVFPNTYTNTTLGTGITNTFSTNFPAQFVSIQILPAAYFTPGASTNSNTAQISP
jgi:hypothetical protein